MNRELRLAIEKLAGTHLKDVVSMLVCTVDSVDKDNQTCDCSPISGDAATSLPGVLLMAENDDGLVVFPAVDSTVVVALSTRNDAYVFMYSEIDELLITISNGEGAKATKYNIKAGSQQFNDGSFGGLVKITQLTTKLNNLITQLKAQLDLIATGIAAGGGSYSPGTLSQFSKTDYENDKIKHGI